MTFGRRPSLGLDQPLYYVQTNVSSAFKLEQSFATPVKGRRVDVCFHPKPGPGLLANTLSHIATFFGLIYGFLPFNDMSLETKTTSHGFVGVKGLELIFHIRIHDMKYLIPRF